MNTVYMLKPKNASGMLLQMLEAAALGYNTFNIAADDPPDLRDSKIIVGVELNNIGICEDVNGFISKLYDRGMDSLEASSAILLLHSNNELYTKSVAQNLIFLMNALGCSFIGHPIIEATGSLNNFLTWKKTLDMPLQDICIELCSRLSKRLINDNPRKSTKLKLLVLHASSHKTSNTLALWNMIKKDLNNAEINELHVENGQVKDCKGCSFTTCTHYSQQGSCFYGGIMVEAIYPAIERADSIIWLAPNYNDAISANLMAVVNRITALYRKISFYDKSIYSVIVSGNSGSDSVARQLLGALNINKGFRLPPHFCIMETANDPGAIKNIEGIEKRAEAFACSINRNFGGRIDS